MKKIIMTIGLFCAVCVSALAQNTITMKFTGRNQNNDWIPLSYVLVENQTQRWQELVYYPDTTLFMGNVGIDDYLQNEKVQLFQNVPNPFDGVTDFALQLDEDQRVLLEIYDVNGKMVAQYEHALPQGQHLFRATLTAPQTYLLSAKTENDRLHIKMVNKGNGGENSIAYLGEGGSIQYQLKSDSKDNAPYYFANGDWMKYVGYANLCGTEFVSTPVEKSQTQSETVNLVFTLPVPTVITNAADNITASSARLNGDANGQGYTLTERGFYYGSSNSSMTEKVVSNGTGDGAYASFITDLNPGSTYYFKAYAKSLMGTAYGQTLSVQTLATYPTVNTGTISDIMPTSAIGQGNVVSNNGATVTERGLCWSSTTQFPTLANANHVSAGTGGNGSYSCSMTGLVPTTTYYVRAYATNSEGTAYGNTVSFTTLAPTVATITTTAVSSITSTSATSGGNITADGGASVTARGVCWSTSQNPTVSNSHTTNGSGTGSFTSSMTGLTAGTTYYVRAYATNSAGTAYGNQVSFTTNALATVTTTSVTSITQNSASSGGNITADGGASVTARGVCWSTSQNPTVSNSHTTNGSGTGSFTSSMTGLTAGTTYYVRAYATNSVGTAYGSQVSFTTNAAPQPCPGAATVTDYDGNTYNTVQIGQQCWMKQNLKTTHYSDGTTISLGSTTSTSTAYRYYPNNSSSNVSTYGYLYNWKAVMRNSSSSSSNPSGVQGICPTGWHVPSDAEWTQLTDYVSSQSAYQCNGSSSNIAKALASATGWNSSTTTCAVGNTPANNNATGFSAVPAGLYFGSGYNFGINATFWSATQYGSDYAYGRDLDYYNAGVYRNDFHKNNGCSVRCVRDESGTTTSIPTVTTTAVSSITSTSATSGGNVTADGGASVTARGVCWSTSQNPTVSNSHTTNGSGTGSFTSSMTGLTVGTTYYVRAYATNSAGTAYGEQVSFTTNASVPTVTTTSVTNITQNSATSGGNVTADGGASVTARGVCWSTSQNPTVSNSHTTNGSGTGSFTSSMTGLTAGTTYYVRAYATNSVGTAYGNQVSFTTNAAPQPCPGAATVTDYDGNTYNTVQIGQQCWMKQNLKTTHYSDGTTISLGSTTSETTAYRYYPNNSSSNVSTYGYLYNWKAVMRNSSSSSSNPSGVQGICPTGWHVPSDAEWTQLTDYVRSQNAYQCGSSSINIAKALASTSGWSSSSNTCAVGNTPANNNATGFSAVPAGYYNGYGYDSFGNRANFWSATLYINLVACYRYLNYSTAYVGSDNSTSNKSYGFSVRCLRDESGSTASIPTVTTTAISSITSTTAVSGGNVTSDGGATVTARGVCWSTSQNPTVSNSHTTNGSGTGSFSSSITGLSANTTYYVRAYATNSVGTAYGSQISFTTSAAPADGQPCPGTSTVTDYDNNTYNTVQIGQQCWMKQNLKTTHYSDGTTISLGSTTSETTAYRYYPNNSSSNVSTYGYLYNWKAVMRNSSSSSSNPSGVQGICPTGWHVPSDAEWTQLENYVGSQSAYQCGGNSTNIAKALASTTGWNSSTSTCSVGNTPANNNATGFSAVPAGYYRGGYNNFSGIADFWGATQTNSGYACRRGLGYDDASVYCSGYDKSAGFSVRCLRDESSVDVPTVTTTSVTSITQNSATSGGNVTATGGASVTARGVCWSTSQNPTVSNSHTTNGSGTGSFTSSMTGLTAGTTYYVRAYATNSAGTAYGEQKSFTTAIPFTCGTSTVTDYDGNTYNTVQIGQQCWMKQNLRTTHYSDGTSISLGSSNSTTTAYRYYPNNSSSNVSTYGYLYNWKAVMRSSSSSTSNPSGVQGICPTGWHVPSDAEWTQLTDYVRSQNAYQCGSSSTNIAKALASTSGWSSSSNTCAVGNTPANNNATGFSAVPAGDYYSNGYDGFGKYAYFWSATQYDSGNAYRRSLLYSGVDVGSNGNNKNRGYSVRCLRDESTVADGQPCPGAATVTDYDGNTYNTVQIGQQCWMKQNLKTTHYSDGTTISLGSTTSETTAYRYYPNNSSSNVSTYGYLYNWKAVMRNSSSSSSNPSGVQGICPTGWHVPSDAEWTQLENYVGSQSAYQCGGNSTNIAKALASTTGWNSSTTTCAVGNTPANNNATGFSAVPAGYYGGSYNNFSSSAGFWSATQDGSSSAYRRYLSYGYAYVYRANDSKNNGFSVRCLRD